jgi:hypothetical protein
MGMDYSLSFDYEDADLTHLKLVDQENFTAFFTGL